MTIGDLTELLTDQARRKGWKQLYCGPDVITALNRALPPAPPRGPLPDPYTLLAVDIVPAPDFPPGTFRLVAHADSDGMTCEVIDDTVTHARCLVVAEGVLEVPEREAGQ